MSLNLGLLEASLQVTLFINVLVFVREEALLIWCNLIGSRFVNSAGAVKTITLNSVLNTALKTTTTKTEWFGDSIILDVER